MKKEVKKKLTRRFQIIAGQIQGLQKMVNEGAYCIDVITQTSAVRQALSSVEDVMLENHLKEHVIQQMKSGQARKATEEIIGIFKKAKKK